MSSCTTTVPNSVRSNDPVGQTSRQAAWVQCLQTSDIISHLTSRPLSGVLWPPGGPTSGRPSGTGPRRTCSTKATCRHVLAPRPPVLSYELPNRLSPSAGTPFHSLQATSHALHP